MELHDVRVRSKRRKLVFRAYDEFYWQAECCAKNQLRWRTLKFFFDSRAETEEHDWKKVNPLGGSFMSLEGCL